ncbi:MAG TPA: hypothetical protein VFT74_04500, partial [Isosphaeraceae bacterium]|nr:hypothetical protein [Isosphaeraceae bacterium]
MNGRSCRIINSFFPLVFLLLLAVCSPAVVRAQSSGAEAGDASPPEAAPAAGATESRAASSNYVRPAVARLQADVTYLADDRRGGRGPGTTGIEDAADHIAAVFREAGLSSAPGANGYFQPFTIQSERTLGDAPSLSFALKSDRDEVDPIAVGELKKTFTPLAVGGAGSFEDAEVVFAGFGITADDDEHNLHYDDYKDLDVKDRVVLLIRKEPS